VPVEQYLRTVTGHAADREQPQTALDPCRQPQPDRLPTGAVSR
jgi:hypothetical protein